ncbi:hypothetical protein JM18_000690 [Phytophthora kernoviae]|uniref:DNA polymerase delta subunit 3 n=2 Tax=Phytophthora kernoviae TaxID=325452 RepID=A0A921VFC1_9STRA|nr:hypothetical protein G195_002757 [Phytophthora kernoviae 00238/432]KAG2532303.1 hypothetical protein JM18_000690 [Phytophthora kernoviae]
MDRCLEEIGAAVLDAGELLSSVKALQVLITRATTSSNDETETAAAKRDPRARVVRLAVGVSDKDDSLLCHQIYALYNQFKGDNEDGQEATAMATACWAQERQTRNDAFAQVEKRAALSAAAKALYSSGISCVEATARQDFGEEQGEETVSAFDTINASSKKKSSDSTPSSSFFKSSGKTGSKSSVKTGFKSSSSNKNGSSNGNKTPAKEQEVKVSAASMSNVLTIDSDDEEDDETDAPVFVKKASTSGRGKRVISDDDDDEEDEAPVKNPASTPAPKNRNVKRKLNASPGEVKKAKKQASDSEEEVSSKKKQCSESEDESPEVVPSIPSKRQVLVMKTRINEQGYMVTEKTYKEVELTPEEIEKEKKVAQKKLEEKKKKAAAEKAAKTKREAKKQSGPPKQRDLRSFFSMK